MLCWYFFFQVMKIWLTEHTFFFSGQRIGRKRMGSSWRWRHGSSLSPDRLYVASFFFFFFFWFDAWAWPVFRFLFFVLFHFCVAWTVLLLLLLFFVWADPFSVSDLLFFCFFFAWARPDFNFFISLLLYFPRVGWPVFHLIFHLNGTCMAHGAFLILFLIWAKPRLRVSDLA